MKTILSIVIPFLFLGLFILSIVYLSSRMNTLFGLTRRWPMRIGVTLFFIVSLVALMSGTRSESTAVGMIYVIGGYLFSFYVFLLFNMLALHVMQFIWAPSKSVMAWAALALALLVTVWGALWANPFRVSEIEIPLKGLESEIKIMHISDVHIGHHRGKEYLERIVDETNAHNPDLILLNGDLVDSNVALLPGVLSPLQDFEAPAYFVNGNHDNYVDRQRALALIAEQGVRILHNEILETHGIYLVGLDYMNPDDETFDMHPSDDKRTIENVLPALSLKKDKPSVLMHHSPVGAQYVAAKGIDLMLSGHTHAGQMFPGTLFTPFIFPFNAGLYEEGGTKVFVSQGAGTFGTRIRLGTSNEINLINLKTVD